MDTLPWTTTPESPPSGDRQLPTTTKSLPTVKKPARRKKKGSPSSGKTKTKTRKNAKTREKGAAVKSNSLKDFSQNKHNHRREAAIFAIIFAVIVGIPTEIAARMIYNNIREYAHMVVKKEAPSCGLCDQGFWTTMPPP